MITDEGTQRSGPRCGRGPITITAGVVKSCNPRWGYREVRMLEPDTETTDNFAVELSILMPCLNEARTVGACVKKALAYLDLHEINGEVIVADNGSTDGSPAIAANIGARGSSRFKRIRERAPRRH
jgi:hypothetical protein